MAITLTIKVFPQSGKQGFVRDCAGIIKCFLKSAPEGGKANDELVKLISSRLHLPRQHISILQGVTARKKVLRIDTSLDIATIFQLLGIPTQMTING